MIPRERGGRSVGLWGGGRRTADGRTRVGWKSLGVACLAAKKL